MSSIDPRTPVIIGVGQSLVGRDDLPGPEPLEVWEQTVREASRDAGMSDGELAQLDSLSVISCMSWNYDDPTARLSDRLGSNPGVTKYTEQSGTSGHKALQQAANAIRSGESDLAIIVGGECLATLRYYRREGNEPPWSFLSSKEPDFDLDQHQHPDEVAVGLTADVGAVYGFAMRDIARRAKLGVAPEEYRNQLGRLCSGLTARAATNPYAWFPTARDPEFLTHPRPDNRFVSYPYTKHMVAIMDVDLCGALIITSEERADALRIPRSERVYPWSAALAHDPIYVAVRPSLWRSEAMEAASQAVLRAAHVAIDDVTHMDLYSCFPAAVNFAQDALKIARTGDQVTLTGGLPYAGGPASSYMMNSLATMVTHLRDDPGSIGLASGVGMMMTDHAFGLYSTDPPPKGLIPVDEVALQNKLDALPQKTITSGYEGDAVVATYTVMYDREGRRTHGAAICDLPDGSRAYARFTDPDLLEKAESEELVYSRRQIRQNHGVGELVG